MSGVRSDTDADSGPDWRAALAELAVDVDRVADRLRSLSAARLAAPLPPHESRAAAGAALAQVLAEVAQGVEQGGGERPPRWRVVPRVGDFAVGDQVAVTGHDAVAALAGALSGPGLSGPGSDERAWARAGRARVDVLLGAAATAVRELRSAL